MARIKNSSGATVLRGDATLRVSTKFEQAIEMADKARVARAQLAAQELAAANKPAAAPRVPLDGKRLVADGKPVVLRRRSTKQTEPTNQAARL
jgi:hypothetical protein